MAQLLERLDIHEARTRDTEEKRNAKKMVTFGLPEDDQAPQPLAPPPAPPAPRMYTYNKTQLPRIRPLPGQSKISKDHMTLGRIKLTDPMRRLPDDLLTRTYLFAGNVRVYYHPARGVFEDYFLRVLFETELSIAGSRTPALVDIGADLTLVDHALCPIEQTRNVEAAPKRVSLAWHRNSPVPTVRRVKTAWSCVMLSRAPNENQLTRRAHVRPMHMEVSHQLGIPAVILGYDVLQHYKCAFSIRKRELYQLTC